MKLINKYSPFIINTFDTSIFGKEQYCSKKGNSYLVLPVYNLGIEVNMKKLYVNPAYIVFNDISCFQINIIPYLEINGEYQLDEMRSTKLCTIVPNENINDNKLYEIESVSYRELAKSYMTMSVIAMSSSILYKEESTIDNIDVLSIDNQNSDLNFLNSQLSAEIVKIISEFKE